jgi:hypothetical protein
MKLNVFFVAAALAYGSSLVVAQNIESNIAAREVADVEGIVAREPGVDVDAREFVEEEAREPELTDIDARDLDDLEEREEDEDMSHANL